MAVITAQEQPIRRSRLSYMGRQALWGYLFVLPCLLVLLGLVAYPFFYAIFISFTRPMFTARWMFSRRASRRRLSSAVSRTIAGIAVMPASCAARQRPSTRLTSGWSHRGWPPDSHSHPSYRSDPANWIGAANPFLLRY